VTPLWGELFERVHMAYATIIAPLFAVVFFGSVLLFSARKKPDGWAGRALRRVGPGKHRALQQHPAICAACAYPVARGSACPECGAAYNTPGAVLYRDELRETAPPTPRWLIPAAIALVVTLAAWLLSPAALLVGNKMEWGAFRVMEDGPSTEYAVRQAPGAPAYTVQLNTDFIVDARSGGTASPLDGYVYVILEDPSTGDIGWLQTDVIDRSWQFEYYKGGVKAAGLRPTLTATGVGIEAGIAEIYRATGYDNYWSQSQAEVAELQRLGALAVGPNYRTIQDWSSLPDPLGPVVWTRNNIWRYPGYVSVRQPMPVSDTAGVLGLAVLAMPLALAAVYVVVRFTRR
jgi:hypothetical protein